MQCRCRLLHVLWVQLALCVVIFLWNERQLLRFASLSLEGYGLPDLSFPIDLFHRKELYQLPPISPLLQLAQSVLTRPEDLPVWNGGGRLRLLPPLLNRSGIVQRINSLTLCEAALDCIRLESKCPPHVLVVALNENWGALSTPIANRTGNWGDIHEHWRSEGCNETVIRQYLDLPQLRGVVTTQHQVFEHPKVMSIPLGVKEDRVQVLLDTLHANDTCGNDTVWVNTRYRDQNPDLLQVVERIERRFNTAIKQPQGQNPEAFDYQEIKCSRFVMCFPTFGTDSYRIWETLALGSIPILEKIPGGWYHTYDELPVLWVDNFENVTQEMLEKEYVRILQNKDNYNYKRLQKRWWLVRIYQLIPDELKVKSGNSANSILDLASM